MLSEQRVGPYRLLQQLGVGNAASVYLATDGAREVALKLRSRHPPSPKEAFLEARFREGARIQSWLCHPHLVWLYEWLEEPHYQAIALERLEGGDLGAYLKQRGPLEERAACALGVALSDALDHLHDIGVVHRDLKPDNILLSASPLWGDPTLTPTPKLSDFDVSRHPELTPSITEPGSHVGTLWYTSPEQFDQARPCPQDDLYSLGITLYECVSGRLPFEPLNSASIFKRFLDHTPLLPLQHLKPTLSAGLVWVIERAASSRLEERVPSAATLGVLLMAVSPTLARAPRASLLLRRAHHAWLQEQLKRAPNPVQAQLLPSLEAIGAL